MSTSPADSPAPVSRLSAASTAAASTAPAAQSMSAPPSRAPELRRVLAFLGIALGITTALSLPFATGLLPEAAVSLVVPLAQLSPLFVALLVRRRGEPRRRALALSIPSWRVLGIVALGAIAAFVMVPLARVLIGIGAGAAPLAAPAPVLSLLLAVPAVFVMQALFAIGEEAGWRGWLHSELRPLGFWTMSLFIGVMWALWHAPIVVALGLSPREAVTYLGTIVAVAPLLAALREISGTAWAAVIGHGLLNSVRVAIEQNVLGPLDPGTAWLLDVSSWALWLAVAWMVLRIGGSLAPTPAPAQAQAQAQAQATAADGGAARLDPLASEPTPAGPVAPAPSEPTPTGPSDASRPVTPPPALPLRRQGA